MRGQKPAELLHQLARFLAVLAFERLGEDLECHRLADIGQRRPAYRDYVARTNAFFPGPPRRATAAEERAAGESKYSLYRLIRLNFDLVTGFSLVPLQMFSMLGIAISMLSAALFVLLAVRRLWVGPEAEGMFTLFALMFFLIGIALFGIGLLGEYIGRIYQQVRERPRYLIQALLEKID